MLHILCFEGWSCGIEKPISVLIWGKTVSSLSEIIFVGVLSIGQRAVVCLLILHHVYCCNCSTHIKQSSCWDFMRVDSDITRRQHHTKNSLICLLHLSTSYFSMFLIPYLHLGVFCGCMHRDCPQDSAYWLVWFSAIVFINYKKIFYWEKVRTTFICRNKDKYIECT